MFQGMRELIELRRAVAVLRRKAQERPLSDREALDLDTLSVRLEVVERLQLEALAGYRPIGAVV